MTSTSTQLLYGEEAREKIVNGISKLAKAVIVTLGPNGKNVIISYEGIIPHATKDGVTVATSIMLEDEYENIGCQLTKDAASRTATEAGDGTTTATLLVYQISKRGLSAIEMGANSVDLKKGMLKASAKALELLEDYKREVDGDDLLKVATVSANNDPKLGKIISDAYNKLGKNALITVDRSKDNKTSLKVEKGYHFGNGWINNYFITDAKRMLAEYEDCKVLVTDSRISSLRDIQFVLDECHKRSVPLLIIAKEYDEPAKQSLVANRIQNGLKVVAVEMPKFGNDPLNVAQDLATYTGATFISASEDKKLNDASFSDLGTCSKVIIRRNKSILFNDNQESSEFFNRVASIKESMENEDTDYGKERFQERLSKMEGGVGVLYIGGSSEVETGHTKDRVDDALSATKAAYDEGVLIGGGIPLLRIGKSLLEHFGDDETDDELEGIKIVADSLLEPAKQIYKNSGEEPSTIVRKILSNDNKTFGYNALSRKFGDLEKMGVLDPYLVVKNTIENSVSVASMILTTDCAVVPNPDLLQKFGI